MSELFSQFGNSLPQPIYCKQTKHKTKTNLKALLAWQAHILQNITHEVLDSFSLETLDEAFFEDTTSSSEVCDSQLEQEANLFTVKPLIPSSKIKKMTYLTLSLDTF